MNFSFPFKEKKKVFKFLSVLTSLCSACAIQFVLFNCLIRLMITQVTWDVKTMT